LSKKSIIVGSDETFQKLFFLILSLNKFG